MLRPILTLTMLCLFASTVTADDKANEKEAEVPAVLDFEMDSLNGQEVDLAKYKGKVILMVNVASKCGYTPQYEGLQDLHEKYGDQGFVVLGFPCNQFGSQEPGSSEDIQSFCKKNYGVTFDMFEKVDVNGPNQAELYAYLTSEKSNPSSPGPVKWNFEKFLISKDGKVAGRYRSKVAPESVELTEAIETELKK